MTINQLRFRAVVPCLRSPPSSGASPFSDSRNDKRGLVIYTMPTIPETLIACDLPLSSKLNWGNLVANDHNRLLELFHDFDTKLSSLHTLYLDSIVSYSILYERLRAHQSKFRVILGDHELATETSLNKCLIEYRDISTRNLESVSSRPLMYQGDLAQRTTNNGDNTLHLGNLCVVDIYCYWDGYLRREIEDALGQPRDSLKEDLWGDLRHLRNCIIHNQSVAYEKISECKVITCFRPGEKIILDSQKMSSLFNLLAIYRDEIYTLSFPQINHLFVAT